MFTGLLAGRDVAHCTAGLVISVVLAFAANPAFRASILEIGDWGLGIGDWEAGAR